MRRRPIQFVCCLSAALLGVSTLSGCHQQKPTALRDVAPLWNVNGGQRALGLATPGTGQSDVFIASADGQQWWTDRQERFQHVATAPRFDNVETQRRTSVYIHDSFSVSHGKVHDHYNERRVTRIDRRSK